MHRLSIFRPLQRLLRNRLAEHAHPRLTLPQIRRPPGVFRRIPGEEGPLSLEAETEAAEAT